MLETRESLIDEISQLQRLDEEYEAQHDQHAAQIEEPNPMPEVFHRTSRNVTASRNRDHSNAAAVFSSLSTEELQLVMASRLRAV